MLRLPLTVVAERAGVDVETVRLAASGQRDARGSTLNKINQVLVAEERRVLTHLLALHGASQTSGPADRASLLPTAPALAPAEAGAIYRNGVAA